MSGLWSKLRGVFVKPGAGDPGVTPAEAAANAAWQATYSAREAYYRKTIGEFPEDILKVPRYSGVWPGGGLFVIPATRIDSGLTVYSTFGLTNPDMPTRTRARDVEQENDALGRFKTISLRLESREPAAAPAGAAGYGYELVVLTDEPAEWPLWILQWSLNAEIDNDVGLLKRVEKYAGLTVQEIRTGDDPADMVNLLFAKASSPVPAGVELPNGRMQLLVATVITEDEMQWSQTHGRDALLAKLMTAGIGQISRRNRKSVLQ
ncbi:MAG TPA: suppressor of fused domain protein [Steroidobacteraceae bacterium]|jgi:hypothetical protein|nr:suppressor of fused domain protein [Steroidobacteraceae bacterium]